MSERIGDVPKGDIECSEEDLQKMRDFEHQARMEVLKHKQGFDHGKAGRLPLDSSSHYWRGYAEGKREFAKARKSNGLCACCGGLH